MGYGIVGSGVADILTGNGDMVERAVGQQVNLVKVLDIRQVDNLPEGVTLTSRFEDILEDERVRIVVEAIGGVKPAYEFTRRALESGRHVVTSNKELVAERGDELNQLADERGVMYLYEASVGGGIPILRPLNQCLTANRILGIDGIVNGSTNYLLTRMATDGVNFPVALGEAKRLGYVEGNPAADVEGWDARRKLAILANAAFGARLSDDIRIPTEGISGITDGDIACAAAFHGALKLIAHAQQEGGSWTGWVHPALVPEGHPLYAVNDVFNGILVHADRLGDALFYGRGAGSQPTASAVVADIIDEAQHLDHPKRRLQFAGVPTFREGEALPARLLLRVSAKALDRAEARIEEALPGSEFRRVERPDGEQLLAVRTPVRPYRELIGLLGELVSPELSFGTPIRCL